MAAVISLFSWLPTSLQFLFRGAIAIFILVALFKLILALINLVTDLIPGW